MRGKGRRRGGAHTVGRTSLTLAVIAVIVTCDKRLLDVNRVSDCFAETVTSERHCVGFGMLLSDWINRRGV